MPRPILPFFSVIPLLTALPLAGCGQKGALFLPDSPPPAVTREAGTPTQGGEGELALEDDSPADQAVAP
ncbi:MAG: lipoprotein [Candidatus Competibacterales bacterium]